jgi:hypothetical protein
MDRRDFLGTGLTGLATTAFLSAEAGAAEGKGETLYNGIELPANWPPQRQGEPPRDPVTPPYLEAPPAVIPIDVGRQLFVDDFLVADTTLRRTFHTPEPHPDNPLVRPDKPWEQKGRGGMAMVFSDGVWFDPKDRLFKMWYLSSYGHGTAYAVSEDGLRWKKPELDVVKGTNVVQPGERDSSTVWLDLEEKAPARRFKMFRSHGEKGRFGLSIHFSADGIHWAERAVRTGSCGDRSTVFWNPFRKRWVFSLRHGWGLPRKRRYWEAADLVKGPHWTRIDEPTMWTGSDKLDPPREDLRVTPELYNLDCVAYESLVLGLFSIWRGDKNIPAGRPKPNNVCLGFSRDGFHWSRPERRPFLDVSERPGDWNWGNVQSAGGCCLVVGDRLYFYYSGRAGTPGNKDRRDTGGSTGLAILRRDGFASLDAGKADGTLTTRPVRFTGKHLFVNLAAPAGELTAEVLDERGQVLPGLSRADCVPVRGDSTKQSIGWKSADLTRAAGKTVKFRFHLKNGQLYAFWVSPEAGGASRGYVAAGGPGLAGPLDAPGGG